MSQVVDVWCDYDWIIFCGDLSVLYVDRTLEVMARSVNEAA